MAQLLHNWLHDNSVLHPAKVAVSCRESTFSYRDLDQWSWRVAHQIQQMGVRPGDRVALWLSKSPRAVAALFGILRAGAVYVPLDRLAPVSRIRWMLEDCGVRLLFSESRHLKRLRAAGDEISLDAVVCCQQEAPGRWNGMLVQWDEMSASPSHHSPDRQSDDLALILYTSGSTGTPKGVAISHRAACSFVNWAVNHVELGPDDRVSNHAPLQFDLSVFDIFGAVKSGASLIQVPEELSSFPAQLAEFLRRERISVSYSVPSMWLSLLSNQAVRQDDFPALRAVLFAGEIFPQSQLRQLAQRLPQARLFNLFGPTETNVCTVHEVTSHDLEADCVPIGEALPDASLWVVDEDGRPVEPGAIGELWVAGPLLMTGYWNQPAKTAAVLVADPEGTGIAYRTGDLVQSRSDGVLLFRGRVDEMVKCRGYRVELGEIETVLSSVSGVLAAAAVGVTEEGSVQRIEAFFEGNQTPETELIQFLRERLPGYMVPHRIIWLEHLPRTSSGKVDKESLRTMVQSSR